ncbi:hypothetical protein [Microbacterium rhizosphaerae]
MWAQKLFPPLYRVSTMDPETVLHGSFGSSPVRTIYVFAGEDGVLHRPRLEVHTFVDRNDNSSSAGDVDSEAPILWMMNFNSAFPETTREPVPVLVSGTQLDAELLAREPEGWMVSVETPDAILVISGPGELPAPLAIEPLDMEALKRSEFRNSGISIV